jgi:proline racemase
VFERMLALRADDSLRRLLLREPRGSVAVHANLIVPTARDDCAAGFASSRVVRNRMQLDAADCR